MQIQGRHYRTLWEKTNEPGIVQIINQCALPHTLEIRELVSVEDFRRAISEMEVRGAGLIGATAAYGMVAAARYAPAHCGAAFIQQAAETLMQTRPTAVNLAWAVQQQVAVLSACPSQHAWVEVALQVARKITDGDAAACLRIGEHTLPLIREIASRKKGAPVNILTHCNAGWLAFVDYGSATAGIYAAHDAGIPVHVWVDETRPRNQGASLTAWELGEHGVPHHLIADNTGGHLMQHGMVDLVIVGADRVTRRGDVANKIGTYLKALAAKDNQIPFYVALPSSTFDLSMADGLAEIPVEERGAEEVRQVTGMLSDGTLAKVRICPESTPACNYGFDVTPARLVTGLICEKGICAANEEAIKAAMITEGYVKFSVHLKETEIELPEDWQALNAMRTELFDHGMIGVLPDGIGFGNISVKASGADVFFISGTATGGKRVLDPHDYCRVDACSIDRNEVYCSGQLRASAETLSHYAVYQANNAISCVIHVHHKPLFQKLLASTCPATSPKAAYGTPEMARDIAALVRAQRAPNGVLVMTGHEDGVIAWGTTVAEAYDGLASNLGSKVQGSEFRVG